MLKKYIFTDIIKKKMHSISLFIVGVLLAITICPYTSYATTTESTELEEPKILPLTDAKTSNDDPKLGYSELWQEDDREVLIRNERGAKDNVQGTTTGKKQNKKDKNQMNKNSQKHLNKPDTNLNSDTQNIPNNTPQQQQHQTNVKKHQQKHEKHEKNSKKHASTEKPKPKDESKTTIEELATLGMNTLFLLFFPEKFYVFTPCLKKFA